jgi:hypothetical protein
MENLSVPENPRDNAERLLDAAKAFINETIALHMLQVAHLEVYRKWFEPGFYELQKAMLIQNRIDETEFLSGVSRNIAELAGGLLVSHAIEPSRAQVRGIGIDTDTGRYQVIVGPHPQNRSTWELLSGDQLSLS